MTYKTLANKILALKPEQQDCDVTIQFPDDELVPMRRLLFADKDDDVLDEGHPVITI